MEVDAEFRSRQVPIPQVRRLNWVLLGGEGVLEFFGLSIEDGGEIDLRFMHSMPRFMKAR